MNEPPFKTVEMCPEKSWNHSTNEIQTCVRVEFQFTIKNYRNESRPPIPWNFIPRDFANETSYSAEELPNLKWKLVVKDTKLGVILLLFPHKPESNSTLIHLPGPVRVKCAILTDSHLEKIMTNERYYPSDTEPPLKFRFLSSDKQDTLSKNIWGYTKILQSNDLTIWCEIETWTTKDKIVYSSAKGKNSQEFQANHSSNCVELVNHFEKLYETMIFSDVVFNIRGNTFRAHKCILSARSPVFATMFEHEAQEKLSECVFIPDIEPEVFQDALRFIYTGQIHPTQMIKNGAELLVVADKYLLENLKQCCEESLLKDLSIGNCVDLLLLADRHSAEKLKKSVLDYIHRNPVKVMTTESWERNKEEHSQFIIYIQECMIEELIERKKRSLSQLSPLRRSLAPWQS